jgi:FAD synthetase
MKKVMAFGAFDILHKGHEHYLKEAKNYGDYLIVLVARDQNIAKIKGKKAVHNELFRLEQIVKLDFVDEAVLGIKKITLKLWMNTSPISCALAMTRKQ